MALRTYKCKLPMSGSIVEFREITFQDREDAIKLLNDLGRTRTNLSIGDILASYAIVSVDDKQPFELDPTKRMNSWHYKDASYYITFFSQICLVTDEDLEEASREAKKLQMQYMSGRHMEEDSTPKSKTSNSMTSLKTEDLK